MRPLWYSFLVLIFSQAFFSYLSSSFDDLNNLFFLLESLFISYFKSFVDQAEYK